MNNQKRGGRVSDEELFARLIFYGTTLLGRSETEVWLMPLGHLLDQWEIYKQFNGLAKAKRSIILMRLFHKGFSYINRYVTISVKCE